MIPVILFVKDRATAIQFSEDADVPYLDGQLSQAEKEKIISNIGRTEMLVVCTQNMIHGWRPPVTCYVVLGDGFPTDPSIRYQALAREKRDPKSTVPEGVIYVRIGRENIQVTKPIWDELERLKTRIRELEG